MIPPRFHNRYGGGLTGKQQAAAFAVGLLLGILGIGIPMILIWAFSGYG